MRMTSKLFPLNILTVRAGQIAASVLGMILLPVGFTQPAATSAAFEAADVHPIPLGRNQFMRGGTLRAGHYELKSATMVDLIGKAYGVENDNVLGGPSWLEMDRFDVIARAPAKSTPDELKTMLQALLKERFNLLLHNDTKPMPAYGLTAGKRPTLKPAEASIDSGCKFSTEGMGPQSAEKSQSPPTFIYKCRNATLASFVETVHSDGTAWQYVGDTALVDRTELKGAWDFDLKFSPRGMPGGSASDTITIFDALDKQLGLKLEPAKVPMPVIMVDAVNQTPTGNLPGVAEKLQSAAPLTEFEVADVKPSDPDTKGPRFQIQPGGRINLQGVTLKLIIQQAWNVTDDMLVGAPKWLDSDKFDIVAKASTTGLPAGQNVDFDTILLMLRALVTERFKLATHMENRPISAYTLTASKPKLKKADPASRTRFKEGPATLDAKDPRNANPTLARLVTCQNMTMAQLALQLQNIAPGYIHSAVENATGLEGGYDFTLSFSPAGMVPGGGGRGGDRAPAEAAPPSGNVPAASDPFAGRTLFEAMEKELGLKMELKKRSLPVLVIDHVEQKPIDN